MAGDALAQLRDTGTGRVLVVPGSDRCDRGLGDLGRAVGVGEALSEVDRAGSYGQGGHLGEDRLAELAQTRLHVGVAGVTHRTHGTRRHPTRAGDRGVGSVDSLQPRTTGEGVPATSGPTSQDGAMDDAALAIDIGGTKVAAGVVTSDGAIVARRRQPTDHSSAEALYAQVLGLARAVRAELSTSGDHGAVGSGTGSVDARVAARIVVCGVGCGGPARDHHRLMSPLNIAVWRDFPLRDRLGADLGLAVHVDNDAKAFTLAEGWLGAAAGVDDYLAMVVSTGVGGGIVSGGRLLEGADGNAGHIGHLFVDPDGGPDALGVHGLLEGSASGTASRERRVDRRRRPTHAVRRRTGELVGRAVAGVANLLDLRLAVVGGSVALGFGDDFFTAAQETLDALCRLDHSRGARIVPAGLGADAPLVGAAAVGFSGSAISTACAIPRR